MLLYVLSETVEPLKFEHAVDNRVVKIYLPILIYIKEENILKIFCLLAVTIAALNYQKEINGRKATSPSTPSVNFFLKMISDISQMAQNSIKVSSEKNNA